MSESTPCVAALGGASVTQGSDTSNKPPRSERLEKLLDEADGDLRQYVQNVLLDAWALYDKTDQRSKRTLRIATIACTVSIFAIIVSGVRIAQQLGWL